MNFFRSCSWLLPAAFLLAAFTFLLTHAPSDPALAVYPFLRDWIGAERMPQSPEVSFFFESALLFLFPYVLWLAFVFLVAVAERGVFGRRPRPDSGPIRRAFVRLYVVLVLAGSVVMGATTGVLRRKLGGGTQVGAMAVAAAPFASGILAALPAIVLAPPLAGLLRLKE